MLSPIVIVILSTCVIEITLTATFFVLASSLILEEVTYALGGVFAVSVVVVCEGFGWVVFCPHAPTPSVRSVMLVVAHIFLRRFIRLV